eukprot:TRINITY_DN1277_c0_g1_i2.p1 TRINITY_DN1277_c0_g1~~TRINITY_DN1277_c0_g1_i2.p1  ORF type:complete len:269 (-),score=42.81 TRINITY_DN1277_c0_g1_i2:98-844(-)
MAAIEQDSPPGTASSAAAHAVSDVANQDSSPGAASSGAAPAVSESAQGAVSSETVAAAATDSSGGSGGTPGTSSDPRLRKGRAIPKRGGSARTDEDPADAHYNTEVARRRARRRQQSKRLQYTFLFKTGAFLVMLTVVLITKQVQKWMDPTGGSKSADNSTQSAGLLENVTGEAGEVPPPLAAQEASEEPPVQTPELASTEGIPEVPPPLAAEEASEEPPVQTSEPESAEGIPEARPQHATHEREGEL